MSKKRELNCARCKKKICLESKDCFEKANSQANLYSNKKIRRLHHAASAIEARYYKKATRLREVILFAKELGCKSVGLAFCIGLAEEAKIIEEILSRHFHVASVCCKACACNPSFAKEALDMEKEVGTLLPCNVIVYESGDGVQISIQKPTEMMKILNNNDLNQLAKKVESKLQKILDNL